MKFTGSGLGRTIKSAVRFRNIALGLFSVLALSLAVAAQSEVGSASIDGSVSDSNGAAVNGAAVAIRNKETGLSRNVVTGDNGKFSAPVLPVGSYTVTVNAAGFAEAKIEALLNVGETRSVSITLVPAGAQVEVQILSDNETIDAETPSSGSQITQRSIENLPIRGRNFPEFVQLTPGVVQEGDRKGLVIAGQRSINSNVSIDGADFNDSLQGNQRGGNDAAFFFPQTAIKEFQVVRSGATAEIGRTGSGFVNAVTKSGTNTVSGEFLFQNRNDRLTARDAFGRDGANKQNLFGGSVGGPIKKDKAFYFFGLERNMLEVPFYVVFAPSATPLPSDIAGLQGEQISTNNPTSFFSRFDFNINENNNVSVQYLSSRFTSDNFVAIDEGTVITDIAATQNVLRKGASDGVKASWVSIIGGTMVNDLRAQIATDNRDENSNVGGPDIRVTGIGRFGGSNSRPRIFNTLRYQVSDNMEISRSNHRFKLGVDVNINRWEAQRVTNGTGTWRFNSLTDFINRIPARFDQAIPLIPSALLASGYQKEYAVFFQDTYKPLTNLTISAGLRWEGLDNPTPPNPNPALPLTADIPDDFRQWQPRLGIAWDIRGNGKSVVRVSSGLFNARTPSILFYRVFVNNDIVTKDIRVDERSGACRTETNPTLIPTNCYFRGSGALLTFPNVLSGLSNAALVPFTFRGGVAVTRAFGFDPDFKNPTTYQGSATFEQSIGTNYALSVGYIRASSWDLQRRLDRNLPVPVIGTTGLPVYPNNSLGGINRPNPNIGIYSINESSAHSTYDALALSLRRRFEKRFQMEMNYTLANNRDDDSNERNFAKEGALNVYNLKAEAGPSKQDVRHNLNVSSVFDLGKGFLLSGIIITRSGFPFQPRIIDGSDYNNDGNDANDRPVVNGTVLGRHTGRQPYFFNLDVRLLKTFSFGEKKRLALSAEVFNVTRNTNKGFGPDAFSDYCTTNTALASSSNPMSITCPSGTFPSVLAGKAYTAPSTARFGGPRQLQLGLRFSF